LTVGFADAAALAASVALGCIFERDLRAVGEFIGWHSVRAIFLTFGVDIGGYDGEES
jgi:hypothetical protein